MQIWHFQFDRRYIMASGIIKIEIIKQEKKEEENMGGYD